MAGQRRGVALPTYSNEEPAAAAAAEQTSNLFSCFSANVGLLAAPYANGIQLALLNGEKDISFGAVFEERRRAQETGRPRLCAVLLQQQKAGGTGLRHRAQGQCALKSRAGKDHPA